MNTRDNDTDQGVMKSDLLETSGTEMFEGLESGGSLKRAVRSADGCTVELFFDSGNITVAPEAGGTVALTVEVPAEEPGLPVPSRPKESWAVTGQPAPLTAGLREGDQKVDITWEGGSMEVERKSGAILVRDEEGAVCFRLPGGPFFRSAHLLALSFETGKSDRFFGLGEKSGAMNRRGRLYEMWNSDEPRHTPERDPLYVSIPLLYRHDGERYAALFLDEEGRSWFDLADQREDRFVAAVPLARMRLRLWSGRTIRDVFAPYSRLTGRPPLPPLWSLGYHQSRYSYFTEAEVRTIAGEFRKRSIPCDVIHLDIDYMDGYKVFTWDSKAFPDPEKLTADLREEGFRTVTIIDPGVGAVRGYTVFEEGRKKGHFLTSEKGKIYIGAVWPGRAAYPDFPREESREWWAEKVAAHIRGGVSGIWNDMNEPSDFTGDPYHRNRFTVPDSVRSRPEAEPVPFPQLHNVYGQGMCMATRRGILAARPEERPFVLSRAGYAGIQRYAALWTGDNNSWWEHMAMSIPMLIGLGISGVPFVGSDAGGFQSNADGELFARWIAYAAFTPFFRGHSAISTRPHEPWAFGPEVETIARKAIEARYRYLPYTYSLFHEAAETGAPVMRPLFWEFPEEPACLEINDQYLFGPSIMAAPVCAPGARARAVYLPEGEWEEVTTGERGYGGRYILAEAPLDRLPLYARCGSVIPMTAAAQHTGTAFWDPLELHIYLPGKESEFSESSFVLFEDDGISCGSAGGGLRRSRARLTRTARDLCLFSLEPGDAPEPAAAATGGLELHLHRGNGIPVEIIRRPRESGSLELELPL